MADTAASPVLAPLRRIVHVSDNGYGTREYLECGHTFAGVGLPAKRRRCRSCLRCPDSGWCHHSCRSACWRVANCEPLSGVFPDDRWPADATDSPVVA